MLRTCSKFCKWRPIYICASCDKRLKETSNENAVLPYCGKYPHAVAGANFLKALNQWPEDVCTCCHHMLFHKMVQLFHTTHYDMSDETLKEGLPHCYLMRLHSHTSHENDKIRTNKWPQFVADDMEHDDIYVPEQACVNGLYLMTSHKIYKTYFHWREELFLHQFHS